MKKIIYKVHSQQLLGSRFSTPETRPVVVAKEVPYSEAALEWAKAEALPGTLEVLEEPEQVLEEIHDKILLKDRGTDKVFKLYVENGKLMMEVI